jgi:hypothetical protein
MKPRRIEIGSAEGAQQASEPRRIEEQKQAA